MEEKIVSLKKYVFCYLGVYIASSVIIGGFLVYFDIDSSSPSSAIIIVAALGAVASFVKDHGRIPNKSETWSLTWKSCLLSLLASLVAVAAIIAYYSYDAYNRISIVDLQAEFAALDISLNFIYIVTIVVLILHLGLTRFGYWISNKINSKQLALS